MQSVNSRQQTLKLCFDALVVVALGYLGADFVQRFHETHPDITLSVVDTTDELALNSLSVGHADFAIGMLKRRNCATENKEDISPPKNLLNGNSFPVLSAHFVVWVPVWV